MYALTPAPPLRLTHHYHKACHRHKAGACGAVQTHRLDVVAERLAVLHTRVGQDVVEANVPGGALHLAVDLVAAFLGLELVLEGLGRGLWSRGFEGREGG